jgi:hypothetical protein
LAQHFLIIQRLVQKSTDGILRLRNALGPVCSSCDRLRTSSIFPRDASHLGVSHKNGQSANTSSENSIWQATGKRHCSELSAYSVAKHSQDATATPMMIKADWTTRSEPRLCAGSVSDCRIGTATVDSPTPTPPMMRETNICQ